MPTSGEYRDSDGLLVMIHDLSSVHPIPPEPTRFHNVDQELVDLRKQIEWHKSRETTAAECISQLCDRCDELEAEIAKLEQLLSGKPMKETLPSEDEA